MIRAVTGRIDGADAVFAPLGAGNEEWRATLPALAEGSHTVELWLTDGAGNVAYHAEYLVEADWRGLVVRVVKVLEHKTAARLMGFGAAAKTEGGVRPWTFA
jgi:hypothetical protein